MVVQCCGAGSSLHQTRSLQGFVLEPSRNSRCDEGRRQSYAGGIDLNFDDVRVEAGNAVKRAQNLRTCARLASRDISDYGSQPEGKMPAC